MGLLLQEGVFSPITGDPAPAGSSASKLSIENTLPAVQSLALGWGWGLLKTLCCSVHLAQPPSRDSSLHTHLRPPNGSLRPHFLLKSEPASEAKRHQWTLAKGHTPLGGVRWCTGHQSAKRLPSWALVLAVHPRPEEGTQGPMRRALPAPMFPPARAAYVQS